MTANNWQPQFDDRFQRHFVAYLVRDNHTLMLVRDFLDADLFSNEVLKGIVRLTLSFYDQYGVAPDDLIVDYIADFSRRGLIQDTMANLLATVARELLEEKLHNRDFILDKYDEILRHISFGPALQHAAELGKKGMFDEALQHLKKEMQKTPRGKIDLGDYYTVDPSERIIKRNQQESQIFYTLIPALDRRKLYLRRGELAVLQGQRSGIGKSAALAFFARNLAFQNKRSLIYTMELSQDQYMDRLDMACAALSYSELSNGTLLRERISRMIRRDDMIKIKQFPSYTTSVDMVRGHHKMLQEQEQFYPDVVFIDYDDLLFCGVDSLRGDLHEAGKSLYSQLRGWAVEDNIGIWTAAQSGRGGAGESVANMNHISGSIAKAQIADLVLSINRDAEEEVQGITRIFASKVRNAHSGMTFEIPTCLERMQFWNQQAEHQINSLVAPMAVGDAQQAV